MDQMVDETRNLSMLREAQYPLVGIEQQRTRPLLREDLIFRGVLGQPPTPADWPTEQRKVIRAISPDCKGANFSLAEFWHCAGAPVSWETSNGKTIYSTSGLHLTPIAIDPSPRRCLRPSIHQCSQRGYDGSNRVFFPEQSAEPNILRLDHHSTRSFEKRHTKGFPGRGGPWGYAGSHHFREWNISSLTVYKSLVRNFAINRRLPTHIAALTRDQSCVGMAKGIRHYAVKLKEAMCTMI